MVAVACLKYHDSKQRFPYSVVLSSGPRLCVGSKVASLGC